MAARSGRRVSSKFVVSCLSLRKAARARATDNCKVREAASSGQMGPREIGNRHHRARRQHSAPCDSHLSWPVAQLTLDTDCRALSARSSSGRRRIDCRQRKHQIKAITTISLAGAQLRQWETRGLADERRRGARQDGRQFIRQPAAGGCKWWSARRRGADGTLRNQCHH